MDIEPWDPSREFARVRAEADALFARFYDKVRELEGARAASFFPTTDVVETAGDLRIFISLPGVVEEDIDIAFEGGVLVVRGEREPPYDAGRHRVHLGEWRYGYFERRFELPAEVEVAGLSATFQAGVLTVVVPKRGGA